MFKSWTNRETWIMHHWLASNEDVAKTVRKIAKEKAPNALREMVEESISAALQEAQTKLTPQAVYWIMASDDAFRIMDVVNWREIVDSMWV